MSSGRLLEDFVPISDTLALITTGRRLNQLDAIERVEYAVSGERVKIGKGETLLNAESVRLGGVFDGKLVYSSCHGVAGIGSRTAHQPFVHEGDYYYTDDWPNVRIYRNGELFLDHFGQMIQVGNPCWAGGVMYFEARSDDDPKRPDRWEVWRLNGRPEFVRKGANPAAWGGKLFFGEWNGRSFDYRCTAID